MNCHRVLFTFITILKICWAHVDDDLIVELPEGKIRGHVLKRENNEDFYAFQEIPYAALPVGKNRFMPPKDPVPWSGVLNTTENKKICMQNPAPQSSSLTDTNITEDCLYVNVYTPVVPGSGEKLPVFVWIHGGGFTAGSGTYQEYGPEYFMDYGIIVVTMNYRVGPLGFLSTLDGVITGNLGLKDQRQALRWVNSHIGLFGGDPEKVTVAGESAGGHSVGYQLLSENAEGLFRGAIQQSGSALVVSSYQSHAKHYAYEVGKNLDPTFTSQNSSTDLLNLIQNVAVEEFVAASNKVAPVEICTTGCVDDILWAPVIEINTDDPFITNPMHGSFMNGSFHQVPTLIGMDSEESIAFMFWSGNSTWYLAGEYDNNASLLISDRLNIPPEDVAQAGAELKQIYTNSFANDVAAFLRRSTDSGFADGMLRQVECSYKYVPIYLYQFSYAGNITESMFGPDGRPNIPGAGNVGHGEELFYIWNKKMRMSSTDTDSDVLMRKKMLKMWTNFVKFLNPTPEGDDLLNITWPVVKDQDLQYLNIDLTLEVRNSPRNYKQVSSVLRKYIKPPYISF